MFCSACGSEVAEGLRFCNRCGASLGAGTDAPPKVLALIVILSIAVAVVAIVGLLFIVILGTEMMGRRDSTAETYIFIAVIFLIVLGVDALMIRQISRLLNVYLETGGRPNTPAEGRDIPKPPAPELAAPPAGATASARGFTAQETTALHTTAQDTDKVAADTIDQELPTRKL